jgi:poly(3-hydroxybutyrate) depolymerase
MSVAGRVRHQVLGWLLAGLAALPLACPAESLQALPALNIAIDETSVSGLSSGAFMAAQFQVAHSSIVKGAGIVAGGPYYCARNSVVTATTRCSCTLDAWHKACAVSPASTDVADLVAATKRFARAGLIDDPANVARQRAFILAGGKDQTVPATVVGQARDYFAALGMPADNLASATLDNAGHGLPTPAYGGACALTAEPYLIDCDFDTAGKILAWIHGPLKPARTGARRGRFIRFDQTPYFPKHFSFFRSTGLDSSGWLYVPDTCHRGERCGLHVALHGCRQGQSHLPLRPQPGGGLYYGTTFVEHAGYDAWADTNHLVILYPQAVSVPFRNPNGCWDWWGYTDRHYADKQGVQIRALRAMIDRLASGAR